MRTTRSSSTQWNCKAAIGLPANSWPLRLLKLVYQSSPFSDKPLISTIRVDGRPSAPTVASVIALGSGTWAAMACCNQASNCAIGLLAEAVSSSSSRS